MSYQSRNSRLTPNLYNQSRRSVGSNSKQPSSVTKNVPIATSQSKNPVFKTYKELYTTVFNKRMKFYNHLTGIMAIVISLLVGIPFHRGFSGFIMYPIITVLLWIGYYTLKLTRTATVTVEEPSVSGKVYNLINVVSSSNTYLLFSGFILNTFIMFSIIYAISDSSLNFYIDTGTKTVKPFVNENFSFMCFYALASCLIYTLHFMLQKKYIIHIPTGTFRQEPIDYLKKLPFLSILINTLVRTVFISLTLPLIYHAFLRGYFFQTFLKPLTIIAGLNSQLPRSNFHFSTWFKVAFYSGLIDLVNEVLNHLFNAYALVGCLDVNKPLSNYSTTPIQTLLSGIKDNENSLVRVTAFQDLAYLLTSNDYQDRQVFYRADNWKLILSELFMILTNAARSARSNLPKMTQDSDLKKERLENLKKQSSIFGNLNQYKNNLDFDFDFKVNEVDLSSIPNVKLTSDSSEEKGEKVAGSKEIKDEKLKELTIDQEINSSLEAFKTLLEKKVEALNSFLERKFGITTPAGTESTEELDFTQKCLVILNRFALCLNQMIHGTIQEQSNKRIPNKEVIEFSIISLSEILIHAKVEDKNEAVINTLTDCLTILTKVYKGTYDFIIAQTIDISDEDFSIKQINEIALSYFFKVVIYYNGVLNDLLLPPEVFKLAQWCTNMALEQQKEHKLTANILS